MMALMTMTKRMMRMTSMRMTRFRRKSRFSRAILHLGCNDLHHRQIDLLRDDLLWQSAVDRKNILGQTDKSNE